MNYADTDVFSNLPDPPAGPPLTPTEAEATFLLFHLPENEQPELVTGAYLFERMPTETTLLMVRLALANGNAFHQGLEASSQLRPSLRPATHAVVVGDEVMFFPSLTEAERGVEAIHQGRARVRAQAKQPYPDLIQPEIRPLVGGLPARDNESTL